MGKKKGMTIEIGPDGQVIVHVEGVKGKKCVDYSKFLVEALGELKAQSNTSEYYQEEEKQSVSIKATKES